MKILQLEEERNRVSEALSSAVSERARLGILTGFFESADAQFDFPLLRSYYLEFSSAFFQSVPEGILQYPEPEWLSRVLAVAGRTASGMPDAESREAAARCIGMIHAAMAETYFILGEWDAGFDALERAAGETLDPRARSLATRAMTDPSRSPRPALGASHPRTAALCAESAARRARQFHGRRPDRMNLLFVEKDGDSGAAESARGLILHARLRSFLRPKGADEDAIRLNNDWAGKTGSFPGRGREILKIVRGHLPALRPDGPGGRRYLFQFSIPEKEAEYGGNSLEAPMALLLAGGMMNAYYGGRTVRFDQGTAVTAGLDAEGRLAAVDGVEAKIRAAFFSPLQRVVLPGRNLSGAMDAVEALRLRFPRRRLALIGAERLEDLFDDGNWVTRRKITRPLRASAVVARNRRRAYRIAAALVLLAGLGFPALRLIFSDRNPASLDVEGSVLTVKNAAGKELWEHDFGAVLTRKRYAADQHRFLFRDLNGDGRRELLFGVSENALPRLSGRLFCFDSKGRVLFTVRTGRRITFGNETYEDHYRIAFVDAQDLDGDGTTEILTISHQYPWFPCVLNVWSLKGEKLGEYWHAGQLERLDYHDVDRDGIREIFAHGQNNEYQCAVLAVLAPSAVRGASPQIRGGSYEAGGVITGQERYYLRFPQSEIFRLSGSRDLAWQTTALSDGLQVGVANGIAQLPNSPVPMILFYLFDGGLRLRSIQPGDSYRLAVRRLSGRTSIEPMGPVLYFNGQNWTEKAGPLQK
jgi:hypothetical protein